MIPKPKPDPEATGPKDWYEYAEWRNAQPTPKTRKKAKA